MIDDGGGVGREDISPTISSLGKKIATWSFISLFKFHAASSSKYNISTYHNLFCSRNYKTCFLLSLHLSNKNTLITFIIVLIVLDLVHGYISDTPKIFSYRSMVFFSSMIIEEVLFHTLLIRE